MELDDPPIPNSSPAGQHQHRCGALLARALRRSQSTTMRKPQVTRKEGSWKLLALAMGLEPLEPRGRAW